MGGGRGEGWSKAEVRCIKEEAAGWFGKKKTPQKERYPQEKDILNQKKKR